MATDERAHGNISRTNGPSLAKPPLGTPLPASAAATVAAPVPAEEGGGHRHRQRDSGRERGFSSVDGEKRSRQDLCLSCGERQRDSREGECATRIERTFLLSLSHTRPLLLQRQQGGRRKEGRPDQRPANGRGPTARVRGQKWRIECDLWLLFSDLY